MPETQSEFDIRIMKLRVQNLERQFQTALATMREQLARLGDRVVALEQAFPGSERGPATPKPVRKARANSNSKAVPVFDGN
jgi:hypothetical protein